MFVPGKPFHPSLMFVEKAGEEKSRTPLGCSTLRQALGLTLIHYIRLERPARGKHSSLLQAFVNYGRKEIYNIGPRR
jgi:hypothetical protein